MSKIYKTANGQMLDIEKLRLLNETTEAVGNMNINARGDEIDSNGNIVRSRSELMKEYYDNKHTKD
jgi:hypothetical protein